MSKASDNPRLVRNLQTPSVGRLLEVDRDASVLAVRIGVFEAVRHQFGDEEADAACCIRTQE
jgi:hypothetical protein